MTTQERLAQIDAAIDAKMSLLLSVTAQLSEMVSNPRPTYSLDGQSFTFDGYRTWLSDLQTRERTEIQELYKTKNIIAPYIFVSRGGC